MFIMTKIATTFNHLSFIVRFAQAHPQTPVALMNAHSVALLKALFTEDASPIL